jgi:hypothetical protein
MLNTAGYTFVALAEGEGVWGVVSRSETAWLEDFMEGTDGSEDEAVVLWSRDA